MRHTVQRRTATWITASSTSSSIRSLDRPGVGVRRTPAAWRTQPGDRSGDGIRRAGPARSHRPVDHQLVERRPCLRRARRTPSATPAPVVVRRPDTVASGAARRHRMAAGGGAQRSCPRRPGPRRRTATPGPRSACRASGRPGPGRGRRGSPARRPGSAPPTGPRGSGRWRPSADVCGAGTMSSVTSVTRTVPSTIGGDRRRAVRPGRTRPRRIRRHVGSVDRRAGPLDAARLRRHADEGREHVPVPADGWVRRRTRPGRRARPPPTARTSLDRSREAGRRAGPRSTSTRSVARLVQVRPHRAAGAGAVAAGGPLQRRQVLDRAARGGDVGVQVVELVQAAPAAPARPTSALIRRVTSAITPARPRRG